MKQKKKADTTDTPVNDEPATQEAAKDERLRRVMVLISERAFAEMREHFAQAKPGNPLVAVHAPIRRELTDTQRAKRKAYRQRPDVREKQKAYRQGRAQRVRDERTAAREQQATE